MPVNAWICNSGALTEEMIATTTNHVRIVAKKETPAPAEMGFQYVSCFFRTKPEMMADKTKIASKPSLNTRIAVLIMAAPGDMSFAVGSGLP
jgi:hypothetical protein